jgi:hypothetical protein
VSAVPNSDDLVKARSLCENLMRRAIAIDKHNKEFLQSLRQYSAEIERQSNSMICVLRREIEQNPGT